MVLLWRRKAQECQMQLYPHHDLKWKALKKDGSDLTSFCWWNVTVLSVYLFGIIFAF